MVGIVNYLEGALVNVSVASGIKIIAGQVDPCEPHTRVEFDVIVDGNRRTVIHDIDCNESLIRAFANTRTVVQHRVEESIRTDEAIMRSDSDKCTEGLCNGGFKRYEAARLIVFNNSWQ